MTSCYIKQDEKNKTRFTPHLLLWLTITTHWMISACSWFCIRIEFNRIEFQGFHSFLCLFLRFFLCLIKCLLSAAVYFQKCKNRFVPRQIRERYLITDMSASSFQISLHDPRFFRLKCWSTMLGRNIAKVI